MKKAMVALCASLITIGAFAQWKPAGDRIKTEWADKINPDKVLPEYPRPIMERAKWENLNGLWNYAIRPQADAKPDKFDGKILVPFAVESSLSGVMKNLGKEDALWYEREFTVPAEWKGQKVLLHFGAVDWSAQVWVNGKEIGTHTGGYAPFSFDISEALKDGSNTLVVKVLDGTDQSYQPRGKQVNNPNGIWYTPVSGIWQTVWLEPVPQEYISNIKITPDLDKSRFKIEAFSDAKDAEVDVKILDDGKGVAEKSGPAGKPVMLKVAKAKEWSPDSPFLYDVEISLVKDGKTLDSVKSYAAMRKFSMKKGDDGWVRLQLNNKDLFQFGPLDQGWWPDGLYTAPTDEALVYDIKKTKDFGFNMIRKHVKVEPARWYTHCDRLGMIVWQDMPNGGEFSNPWIDYKYSEMEDNKRSEESDKNFRKEWLEIMDSLHSYPCIGVWVPFNEAWGQYNTAEIAKLTKEKDPSRLVNAASGGNFFMNVGDIVDSHSYPWPSLKTINPNLANVCGEYGGIGLALEDHLWVKDGNWGYVQFKTPGEVTDEYVRYADRVLSMTKSHGMTGAVYTQTTDVEGEVNGLMTYDRKVIKVDEGRIREINQAIVNSLSEE